MQCNRERRRILIVDDEAFNRDILEEYLSESGLDFVSVPDGETALKTLADDTDFDCILLDRMMPGLSGIDVLRRIKADERIIRVPVIMQTAAASTIQVREGISEGVYYYLTKPFSRNLLLNIVEAAINEGKERREMEGNFDRLNSALQLMTEASFTVRTPEEASETAYMIACALPDPKRTIVGLNELLLNAVEHGNLGITFEEKSRLLEEGRWMEEIRDRLEQPRYKHKSAVVRYYRTAGAHHIMITDDGNGFDYARYLDINPSQLMLPHGRGVAVSKATAFDEMQYLGKGNKVVCAVYDNSRAAFIRRETQKATAA